ncbi:putative DNA-binding transcriptional regulator YafY [Actinoplanes lutulentus]|nr:WYL domain-containing protein [Actinoplanes lutulentus]MBB2946999.1 putative DNA-binding transcriptional regulator YafY [Actinoplanes lutulentus]
MPTTSARLLSLLSLLQARRDWPGGLLAERLEVSARTVRRDVDRLRELGYPIRTVKGPDGGYRLDAGTRMPPLLFDDDQAVSIAVALQLAGVSGAGIEEGAARALNTIRQVMPARLRHRIDALQITAVEPPGDRPSSEVGSGVLTAIGAAIHAQEILRFFYNDDQARRAEPHHLVAWKGRWYLLAWDLDRAGWRTFRADRITPRTPAGPRFAARALPAPDVASFIAARFRGSEGTSEWPCHGEVIIDRPASDVATYVRDGLVEELGPDRCRVVLGSWSWTGLAASFGRFDAGLEVVGPEELRAAFTTLAERYTAAAG